MADQWIRKTYGLSGGEVQTANSLRGAALVQGAMFATRIRDRFPSVPITEAHPKVVMKVLRAKTWARFARQFSVVAPPRPSSDHERDATISAVSAREGFEGRWKRDLSLERGLSEQDPQAYWLAPVRYFWPET
ncbi:MAG: hypothetical protein ABI639_06305 [Thermoanaerobaculia bacterium]